MKRRGGLQKNLTSPTMNAEKTMNAGINFDRPDRADRLTGLFT